MDTIVVYYYDTVGMRQQDTIGVLHNSILDYSEQKQNEIVNKVLNSGLNVMLRHLSDKRLLIAIDSQHFQQR